MAVSSDTGRGLDRRFLFTAATVGFLLVLLCTSRYGIGLFPDTAHYFSASESLRAGGGLRGYDGAPYTAWPPLYPALLALFGMAGVSPETAARALNALAFGAIAYLSGRFLFTGIRTRLFARAGTISVLLSMPLLDLSVMAYTDLLFVLACLGAILALDRFAESGARRVLVGAAVLTAAAGLLRYMGVAVMLTGLISVVFRRNGGVLPKRLKDALLFGLISALPLALWVVRNLLLSSTAAGGRETSIFTLGQNLSSVAETLTAWLLPSALPLTVRCAVVISIGGALAFAFLTGRAEDGKALRIRLSSAFLFALIYPAILVAVSTVFFSDAISDRLLSPIYVFVMLGLFSGLETGYLLLLRGDGRIRRYSALAALAAILWLGYPLARAAKNTVLFLQRGAGGFSVTVWRESPLAVNLRAHPPRGDVYSNVGNAAALLAGLAAHKSPGRGIAGDMADLRRSVDEGHATFLVWFRVNSEIVEYRKNFYTPPDSLAASFHLERTAEFPDGEIYRVLPGKGLTFAPPGK